MGRKIVITSGKGGVGKSSVAAYLGERLGAMGKRVLLVDMDEGLRSLDLMLGVSSETVFDINDILNGNCTAAKAVLSAKNRENLFLIPAPVTKGLIDDKDKLCALIDDLSRQYDYIIIDSPAGIGDGFFLSVAASDEALLVVNPDPICVRDGAIVSSILRKSGMKNIRLVINKLDTRLMIKGSFRNIDEIIDETEVQLIAAIPTDYEIIRCSATGVPLSDSYARDAFARLAYRLEGRRVFLPNLKKFT